MIGGEGNTQYNARDMMFGGSRYENIQASGNARQHNGNTYNTTNNYRPAALYHSVPTKPADDPIHANFITACAEGQSVNRLNLLVSRGADIDHKDRMDGTPLHHAAFAGHLDIVQYLLDAGADIHAVGTWIGTALSLAVLRGHQDIVVLLLNHKARINQGCGYLGSAAHMACAVGNINIIEILQKKGASFTAKADTAEDLYRDLRDLASASLSASFAYHLTAETTIMSCSAGLLTVNEGHAEVIKHLLASKCGYSVHETGSSRGLRTSESHSELGTTDSNMDGGTQVMLAASILDIDTLHVLLENGADATARNSNQGSAMHHLGGDSSCATRSCKDVSSIIFSLKEKGVDVNSFLPDGTTALMSALRRSQGFEIAKALLDQGASPNIVTENGYTALMCAVAPDCKSRVQCMELLCERGAFVNLKDINGNAALDWAQEILGQNDYNEVKAVLMHFGAKEKGLEQIVPYRPSTTRSDTELRNEDAGPRRWFNEKKDSRRGH